MLLRSITYCSIVCVCFLQQQLYQCMYMYMYSYVLHYD